MPKGGCRDAQDVPLNALGRAQAARAGKTLKKLLASAGVAPEALAFQCSPLRRTRQTLEIARRELGLPPEGGDLDDRLVEFTFGRWEGLTWPEVCLQDPYLARAREADKWNFAPPGGESYAQLAAAARAVARPNRSGRAWWSRMAASRAPSWR